MALWKNTQHTFSAGQLDAALMGRQDIERYHKGASKLENFLVRRQGCIVKRRGTDLAADLTGLLGDGVLFGGMRLVPVVNGDAGRYVILTGGYAFVADRTGILLTTGTHVRALSAAAEPYKVRVPFTDADLRALCVRQSGDTLFIAHRSYPPSKIYFDEQGFCHYETLVFDNAYHEPPLVASAVMLGQEVEIEDVPKSVTFPHAPSVGESGSPHDITPPQIDETTHGKIISSSLAGPNETIGPQEDYSGAVTWSVTCEKRDRANGKKTTTVITKSVTHTHADKDVNTAGSGVNVSTSEQTSSASTVSPLTTKTIRYCATYVKDGRESLPSEPVSLTYDLPWANNTIVKITVEPGDNPVNPDAYNIYKDNGHGFGLIGAIDMGEDSLVDGTSVGAERLTAIDHGTLATRTMASFLDRNALTETSLFARYNFRGAGTFNSGKGQVQTIAGAGTTLNISAQKDLAHATAQIMIDALAYNEPTGKYYLIPGAPKARLRIGPSATATVTREPYYSDSDLWSGIRSPQTVTIKSGALVGSNKIAVTDIREGDIVVGDSGPVLVTRENIDSYASSYAVAKRAPDVHKEVFRAPQTIYAVDPRATLTIDGTTYTDAYFYLDPNQKALYGDRYGGLIWAETGIEHIASAFDKDVFNGKGVVVGDVIKFGFPRNGELLIVGTYVPGASSVTLNARDDIIVTEENIATVLSMFQEPDGTPYVQLKKSGRNLKWNNPPGTTSWESLGLTTDGTTENVAVAFTNLTNCKWTNAVGVNSDESTYALPATTLIKPVAVSGTSLTIGAAKAVLMPSVVGGGIDRANACLRRITLSVHDYLVDAGMTSTDIQELEIEFSSDGTGSYQASFGKQIAFHGLRLVQGLDGYVAFEDDYINPDMSVTPPVKNAEPHFSAAGDYPRCVGIHEQRLVFASTANYKSTIWFSRLADLYQFHPHESIREDDAMELHLAATEFPDINNIVNGRDLIILADGGEWIIKPLSGNALTYKTASAQMQSAIGTSRTLDAIKINTEVIVAERNDMSLRAINYDYASDSYKSVDLSVLAQDVFMNNPIVSMAYKQHPDSTIACVLADGTVATLVYMAEQDVVAWSRHVFSGGWKAKEIVSPKCIINGTTEMMLLMEKNGVHQLWKVRDNINTGNLADVVSLDGLHIENDPGNKTADEVAVGLGGGSYAVGHPIVSRLVTIPPEPKQGQTAQMEIKNATEIEARVLRGSSFKVKPYVASDRAWQTVAVPDLASVDARKILTGSNNRDGRIEILHDGAHPLTILSLSTTYQVEYANKTGEERQS